MESTGGQEMEYCGKLHFSLKYDKELEGLVVKVNLGDMFSVFTIMNVCIDIYGNLNFYLFTLIVYNTKQRTRLYKLLEISITHISL